MATPMEAITARAGRNSDLLVVGGVVWIVVMMILPMPPLLLDLLLACNISLSLLILMLTMNVNEALQFSVFPSLLLVTTLFRLALNISSTRLVLLEGQAGQIIQAFGNFVVGGNMVVGLVIFLILVIIQFIVITKGAERVAEVAARFTLDAMPGKQMSIDADLNAGLINEAEARKRRRSIEQEADFYGAMDGASKFVKGDAIAGIIITVINILGGLAVGVAQRGLPFDQALSRYTILTVGDGLVSQIPALLISTATGILVTRASSEGNMGQDLGRQLLSQPRVLGMAAAVLFLFGLAPGLPTVPFWIIAASMGLLARQTARNRRTETEAEQAAVRERESEESKKPESVLSLLAVDPMELEIGYGLIPLVDAAQGGDLLDRITMIRRQSALELGLVVPPIRIRDNMQLVPSAYSIKIRGAEVGKGELMPSHYMAMDAGSVAEPIDGITTTEPAFGLPALWVTEERRAAAELAGYTVVDAPSVLATHLSELIKRHAPELLGRQDVKALLDQVKQDASAVVDELTPDLLSLGEIQRVLQNLLREGVAIRNLVVILEALSDRARTTKDSDLLTEAVREALARQLTRQYMAEAGYIPAITLDPSIEQTIADSVRSGDTGLVLTVDPAFAQKLLNRLAQVAERAAAMGHQAVVVAAPGVRLPLRRLMERALPRIPVLSYAELAADAEIRSVGMVRLEHEG